MGRQQHRPPAARTARKTGSPTSPVGVRIIGGLFRGRKIEYDGDVRTRPMKDRVREALFNRLGKSVQGKLAVDLFAGTGALGLEAMSRGAARAVFIERHGPTARAILRSAAVFGIEDRVKTISADTFICAKRGFESLLAPAPTHPDCERAKSERGEGSPPLGAVAWLVFCSPPYDLFVDRAEEMLQLVGDLIGAAPTGSLFVVESDARFDTTRLPHADQWDFRANPPAVVGIYLKE